ncbi:Isopentenyl-diphosphate Delta-isomerase [Handroanthus impetiginosus]|uniref:Isopentenyl-diphosphate Delta-isomerase n=1 Tax=Handroanthus impetiginosus TaxID=429701 RepID=A0A2G9H4W0_9LAMI|nr:Isopentenyl-diphosphate Delta-isomerase [Handroanthus impetiginosus]
MAGHTNEEVIQEEYLDVLTNTGEKTGLSKPREDIHRDGDYHRAVHVWIYAESTQELLLQRRAECKDSWAGLWDISSAGHISSGDSSLVSARRELHEELGIIFPKDAFELLFVYLEECVTNDGKFINNEYSDVYLVTTIDPIPLEAFTLQESEVSAVKYISVEEYRSLLAKHDPQCVPYDVNGQYGQLFEILSKRYKQNAEARNSGIQKQLNRYARVSLEAELTGLSNADKEALSLLVKAARIMDQIFFLQVWYSNPSLRDWLEQHADESQLDKSKWMYYLVNKSPWSCLDENEAFLTTADSAVRLLPNATKQVPGWQGLEYRTAFPVVKPPGANFYPPDMDKMEFELWKNSLPEDKRKEATGFFNVIKRKSERILDELQSPTTPSSTSDAHDLYIVPYSVEYNAFLTKASDLLHKAGDLTSSSSLKKLLHSKADAFLSNEYYDSDIAWMELDSKLDITIGPYETYEDTIFGYKATFEAFIGVRDDEATAQVKLFGDNLQVLEKNLPMDNDYKSEHVTAAPIRVIRLIYNAGDVKGPQTVAFNLPNDERIVKDRGTSMVMLKNVSEAKFKLILQPIANACITEEQRKYVDFASFFTHTICHECCHGIGPHTITLPNGQKSTVRLELQELHSALEEAKADIVGLWALRFLVNQNLLPQTLIKSMYVSFLAGCFRSVRFGLKEAHGKGQALQFNYLFEKGAFVLHHDGTFSVDFDKVEDAVESLSREILTIQGRGDKDAAKNLLLKHCVMTPPLKGALEKLEMIKVPVDILPDFPIAEEILRKSQ